MKISRRFLRVISLTLAALMTNFALAVTVPKGTQVPLVFDQSLSSKTARVGDRVKLHVGENVMAGDKVVIKKGSKVTGIINSVKKRGHFGVNAKIQITLNPVRGVGGKMFTLEPSSKGKQLSGSKTDKAGVAAGGGALILGPVGLVGGYFVSGKQVKVKPGDSLVSEVSKDTFVK